MLGSTTLSLSWDSDTIYVNDCREVGRTQALKIRVSAAAAYIEGIRVRYNDGSIEDLVGVAGEYSPSSQSRMIDLTNDHSYRGYRDNKCIASVSIMGETLEGRNYRMGGMRGRRGGHMRDHRRIPTFAREARVTVTGLVETMGIRRF